MSRKIRRSRIGRSARQDSIPEGPVNTPGARPLFRLGLVVVALLPLVAVWFFLIRGTSVARWSDEAVLRFATTRMSEADRELLQQRLSTLVPGLWNPVPEAAVGYLLQPGIKRLSKGATVVSNRAGMRSLREFTAKGDRFRIVILGDSLVMGTGGLERDRWGDQMESTLQELGVTVDGQPIEVYSLGLDGWTALTEATYLTSRFTAYSPDIVIAMMFRNDITDSGGVLGNGVVTYGFTPEHRSDGSGVMIGAWPSLFGLGRSNLLYSGLGEESTSRWESTFSAWRRVEELVTISGGKMLFSVLGEDDLFAELSRFHFDQAGMTSPFLRTDYFGHRLPEDPHPDATGHGILAAHFLHALASRDWLPVEPTSLPRLHEGLSVESVPAADPDRVLGLQVALARRQLSDSIEFDQLSKTDVAAILGGVYPGSAAARLSTLPFGTPRAAFLLATEPQAQLLRVEVDVPPRLELFPFALDLSVNGRQADRLELSSIEDAGRHSLEARLEAMDRVLPAQEVLLTTSSYWTEINDTVTRSYRLVSARQQ